MDNIHGWTYLPNYQELEYEIEQFKKDAQKYQQEKAELTHEILELREKVRRLETKEFLTYAIDDETAYDMDEIIHMSEVIKYLERKLKEQE